MFNAEHSSSAPRFYDNPDPVNSHLSDSPSTQVNAVMHDKILCRAAHARLFSAVDLVEGGKDGAGVGTGFYLDQQCGVIVDGHQINFTGTGAPVLLPDDGACSSEVAGRDALAVGPEGEVAHEPAYPPACGIPEFFCEKARFHKGFIGPEGWKFPVKCRGKGALQIE